MKMSETAAMKASVPPLVLASASSARAALLRGAGLEPLIVPADVDESEIKRALRAEGAGAADAATALAEFKARRVSLRHPGALVVGADQILVCGKDWFDKPADIDQARAHLRALRGKTHGLATAAVVMRDGERIWHYMTRPTLAMRNFSDDFLEDYVMREGGNALSSVGAYRLEGRGVQLFARIDGDFFTILGLPLLPLRDFLREQRVLAT